MNSPKQGGTKPVFCKHCSLEIFDNGTVYVHRRSVFDEVNKRLIRVESQWCNDETRVHMAESSAGINLSPSSPPERPTPRRNEALDLAEFYFGHVDKPSASHPAGPSESVYIHPGSLPRGEWKRDSVNPAAPWKEIGNLLDAWEQVSNDFKCQIQEEFPHLYRAVEQLLIQVERGKQ